MVRARTDVIFIFRLPWQVVNNWVLKAVLYARSTNVLQIPFTIAWLMYYVLKDSQDSEKSREAKETIRVILTWKLLKTNYLPSTLYGGGEGAG